ncbi:MAG: ABC transporter substrate-binding protein [Alterinioella nitratireducens]|jgi:glycine betaine/proline transport system substrate-binding protein|uniref:ABC transporter substrate-binding protein n=1 Tax=Alterinioella nitratireducens TaxID=2735915 RepID=UPI001555FB31|nr:ABC transporter substrate-binding protein [Alterinioella nitratireducens]NPD20703.1 ABC transporter substrate-binding protein [Alterinioella nitratireducens]
MKKLAIAAVVLSTIGGAQAAELGDTGTPIRLAINEWTGQHLTTQIAGQILEEAGYTVEYVTAGYMNMYQAMADGEIHAALEVWESNVSDQYYDQLEAGGVVEVSDLGLTAREGFVYPAHVAEICPGLPAWEALNDCAMQFATAETIPQGRLVDYPADWGTPGADRVAGLELPYRAVPAGSEGALIAELRASTERETPLLMVFWQPHWAVSAYDLTFVDLPAGTPECYEDPSWGVNPDATFDCDFLPSRIFKVAWSGFEEQWPAAYEILEAYQLATEDQQPMMGAVDVDGQSVEEVAAAYVEANSEEISAMIAAATE